MLKPTKQFYVFTGVLAFLLTGCSTLYYAPSPPHLPMVKEKGITHIDASIGAGDHSSSLELDGFHSLTNSLGLMANFSILSLEDNTLANIDFGAGYFKSLDKKFGFEIYSTLGYGNLEILASSQTYSDHRSIFRFGMQPDIFYATKHFEAGLGFRMLYLSYEKRSTEFQSADNWMFEPTLKIAFGGQKFKGTLQGTYTEKINDGMLNYDHFMISLGISLMIMSHPLSSKNNVPVVQ
jgi:hypothetical protein